MQTECAPPSCMHAKYLSLEMLMLHACWYYIAGYDDADDDGDDDKTITMAILAFHGGNS